MKRPCLALILHRCCVLPEDVGSTAQAPKSPGEAQARVTQTKCLEVVSRSWVSQTSTLCWASLHLPLPGSVIPGARPTSSLLIEERNLSDALIPHPMGDAGAQANTAQL